MDTDSDSSSVITESRSAINIRWREMVFFLLLLNALALFGIIVFSYVRSVLRRRSAAYEAGGWRSEASTLEHDAENNTTESPVDGSSKSFGTLGKPPNGVVPILAMTIAWSLSVASQISSEYKELSRDVLVTTNGDQAVYLSSFGLWSACLNDGSGYDECFQAIDFPVGGKMIVARIAAVLASVLGIAVLLFSGYTFWSERHLRASGMTGIIRATFVALFVLLAQLVAILSLLSPDMCEVETCENSSGTAASIAAAVYWFIAVLGLASIPSITQAEAPV